MSADRKPFETMTSNFILAPNENIDTDQIIPGRFLSTTEKSGLGKSMFYDWRYNDDGSVKGDSLFDNPAKKTAKILVAGKNFGCGSSREHAPWSMADYGFKAVLAPSFSDIFKSNCLKIGMLPIEISEKVLVWFKSHPDEDTTVDLEAQEIRCGDEVITTFEVEPFARHQILNGMDDLDFLMSKKDNIKTFEDSRT